MKLRKHKRRGQSLGQKDPLEEGMAPLSSILVWRIQWSEEPGRPHFMGLLGHGLRFHCSTMQSCATLIIPIDIVFEMAQICFLSSMHPTSVCSHSFPFE